MTEIQQRVPVAYLAHVDKHQLAVLDHGILGLQVQVQQAALSRDSIQNLQEEVNTLLRKIAANVHHLLTIML